jgi:hypothetical protein
MESMYGFRLKITFKKISVYWGGHAIMLLQLSINFWGLISWFLALNIHVKP